MISVNVHAGDGATAIRNLKRKMQRELVFRVLKMSKFYEPPSVKRVRKKQEENRRKRRMIRIQSSEE